MINPMVHVLYKDKVISESLLIEGRTWGRLNNVISGLGFDFEWDGAGEINMLHILPKQEVTLGKNINDVQLLDNFNLSEFACKGVSCGCKNAVKVDPELVRRLQLIRDDIGIAITISSAYRCEDYNRTVRGSDGSYHIKGMAADVYAVGMSIVDLHAYAEKHFSDGGIGIYNGHVHVDTGRQRRWDKRS